MPAAPSTLGWHAENAGGVAIEVRDEGIGIDAEELPQVFDRFMRGSRARAHRADGTGIGLSIARAIVEAHGGSMSIGPVHPRGTLVGIHLPAACVAGVHASPAPASAARAEDGR